MSYLANTAELAATPEAAIEAELQELRLVFTNEYVRVIAAAMLETLAVFDEPSAYQARLKAALGRKAVPGPRPDQLRGLLPYHPEAVARRLEELKPKRRPSRKAVREAFEASLRGGTLTEAQKRAIEESGPNRREVQSVNVLQAMAAADSWDRDRAWISDALTQCPLPLTQPKGLEATKVVRHAQTGSGTITVIYTATDEYTLPYGKDAYLLDVLISEARKRKERAVTFSTAIEIMQKAGFDVGGHDYKLFNAALERIGALHIAVTRQGDRKANYRVVHIQNLDLPTQADVARELAGQKRILQYAFEFSEEFYQDFMRFYTVVPQVLLDAFAGAATEYAIARWVYRRVTKAKVGSFIPVDAAHKEIVPSDSNERRFRAKFEKVVLTMQAHWPELRKALEPKRERRKGADVLVGFTLHAPIEPLIPDRRPPTLG